MNPKLQTIVILIFFMIVVLYILNTFKESFELEEKDIEPNESSVEVAKNENSSANQNAKLENCDKSKNIGDICEYHESCCPENLADPNDSNGCYCTHPIVMECLDAYNSCLKVKDLNYHSKIKNVNKHVIESCKKSRRNCCEKLKYVIGSNATYKPAKEGDYTSLTRLCKIGPKGDADLSSIGKLLCSSQDNCKAYAVDMGSVFLYSELVPFVAQPISIGGIAPSPPKGAFTDDKGQTIQPQLLNVKN